MGLNNGPQLGTYLGGQGSFRRWNLIGWGWLLGRGLEDDIPDLPSSPAFCLMIGWNIKIVRCMSLCPVALPLWWAENPGIKSQSQPFLLSCSCEMFWSQQWHGTFNLHIYFKNFILEVFFLNNERSRGYIVRLSCFKAMLTLEYT